MNTLQLIWNLSERCLVGALIYLSFYGLYMFYKYLNSCFEKIVNYICKKRDNKITLVNLKEELNNFKEELDFLDGWKIIQKRDNKKFNDDIIMLRKDNDKLKLDINIIKFDNDLIINKLRNELAALKNSINSININLEKKVSLALQDIKNMNDLEFKDMNNKIFKIKCMIDK